MSEQSRRHVSLRREGQGVYVASNDRGGVVRMGGGDGTDFTPVELLLAAVAGCSAVDVDAVTARRATPETFTADVEALKVRDETGNRLTDVRVTFTVTFPEGEAGDAARAILPRALATSHDRTCTVSRTIEAGTPVTVRLAGA
ncbi:MULTISPECIES: OsmC family protein [unclassified Actinotalea]|uniref:OsmC family protein n=1 Tax=unclassified Actinotalea TaxID=2638618 RepID=UPI0015F67E02|nr:MULTISPECIES: OsmC family protein [unclassified Actinotalea]